jgi:hypothetical protein
MIHPDKLLDDGSTARNRRCAVSATMPQNVAATGTKAMELGDFQTLLRPSFAFNSPLTRQQPAALTRVALGCVAR